MHGLVEIRDFPTSFPWKEPRSNEIPVAMSTLSMQILVSIQHSSVKGPGFLGEWLIQGLRQGKNKMNPEYFVVPEVRKC